METVNPPFPELGSSSAGIQQEVPPLHHAERVPRTWIIILSSTGVKGFVFCNIQCWLTIKNSVTVDRAPNWDVQAWKQQDGYRWLYLKTLHFSLQLPGRTDRMVLSLEFQQRSTGINPLNARGAPNSNISLVWWKDLLIHDKDWAAGVPFTPCPVPPHFPRLPCAPSAVLHVQSLGRRWGFCYELFLCLAAKAVPHAEHRGTGSSALETVKYHKHCVVSVKKCNHTWAGGIQLSCRNKRVKQCS